MELFINGIVTKEQIEQLKEMVSQNVIDVVESHPGENIMILTGSTEYVITEMFGYIIKDNKTTVVTEHIVKEMMKFFDKANKARKGQEINKNHVLWEGKELKLMQAPAMTYSEEDKRNLYVSQGITLDNKETYRLVWEVQDEIDWTNPDGGVAL